MKTIRKVEIKPVFVLSGFMPIHEAMNERVIYISKDFDIAVHLCLCGCGNEIVTPLGGGENWELVEEKDGKISLIGSIGNYNFPCKSHYIITNNIANFV